MCCNFELALVGLLKCLNTFNCIWGFGYVHITCFVSILEYGLQMWRCKQLARFERNNQKVLSPGVLVLVVQIMSLALRAERKRFKIKRKYVLRTGRKRNKGKKIPKFLRS